MAIVIRDSQGEVYHTADIQLIIVGDYNIGFEEIVQSSSSGSEGGLIIYK